MRISHIALSVGLAGLTACASNQPSGQLVQARQAMQTAEARHTATYAPKDLYEAQRLLAKAESAHNEDARSSDELHYAYLAHRVALTAIAHAAAEQARQDKEKSQGSYTDTLEQRSADLKTENAQKDLALVKTQGKLESNEANLNLANQKVDEKEKALAAETQARIDAESRAAAALAQLQGMAAVKEDKERLVITFAGSVLFASGKSVLLGTAREKMLPLASALKEYKSPDPVIIEGHTDDRGSDASNQQLSQARADAVRVYLIESGVSAQSLVAIGKGESSPIADNTSAEGRANNRRVEITVPHRDQLSIK